jgi:TPR repeat protein/alpha-tubulin suppressor-like RCC1 family protein
MSNETWLIDFDDITNKHRILEGQVARNFAWAQNMLGADYYQGTGFDKDAVIAHYWYLKAAKQGDSRGQYNIGMAYLEARPGIRQDDDEAMMWLEKSAAQGVEEAQEVVDKHNAIIEQESKKREAIEEKERRAKVEADLMARQDKASAKKVMLVNQLDDLQEQQKAIVAKIDSAATEQEESVAIAEKEAVKSKIDNLSAQINEIDAVIADIESERVVDQTTDPAEAIRLWHTAAEQGSVEAYYRLGVCYYHGEGVERDYVEALKWIRKASEQGHSDAQKAFVHNGVRFDDFNSCICACPLVGLRNDGTIVEDSEENYTSNWRDVIAVSASVKHTVGLKSNGTVVAVGDKDYGKCDTQDWRDIIAVAVGINHTVGLKKDGTVLAVGRSFMDWLCEHKWGVQDVQGWRDIIAVAVGDEHIVGLRSNGTVIAIGNNYDGRCDTQDWRDIIAVSASDNHTVGLKSNGTVVAVGKNESGECNTQDWCDIIAVSAGAGNIRLNDGGYTVGLRTNGTVAAVGCNKYAQCDTQDWRDIIAVSASGSSTVGLKKDGTVVTAYKSKYNITVAGARMRVYGEYASEWRDIGLVLNNSDFA